MNKNVVILLINFVIISNFITIKAEFKCYECNSYNNPNCAVKPNENLTEVSCKEDDTCITAVVEDITYRGCLSSFSKSSLSPNYTKECSYSLCNNEIYPENRLICYKCSGKNCINEINNENHNGTPCLYFKNNDECFIDVIDEIDTIRGCVSDNNYTFGMFVKKCNTNNCNYKSGIIEIECIQCSSKDTHGCKRSALPLLTTISSINESNKKNIINECKIQLKNTCKIKILLGRPFETCFIYHNLDIVERGCTRYSGLLQSDIEHFKQCDKNLCNNNCLDTLKCYNCTSSEINNCKNLNTTISDNLLINCKSEESSCYTMKNNNEIIRGCGKPIEDEEYHYFSNNNYYQCDNDNGCNSKDIQYCYNCTSENNPICALWSNNPDDYENDDNMKEICSTINDQCVIYTDFNGHTKRGCLKNNQLICNTKYDCSICNGNLCNSGIYPKDRIKCHQCIGTLNSNNNNNNECILDRSSLETLPCLKYLPTDDGCFSYINTENNHIVRSCISDTNNYNKCKLLGNKCKICYDNGCNYDALITESKLSCIKCNYKNDLTCLWAKNSNNSIKCKNSVRFYENESCYTYYKYDNSYYSNNLTEYIKGCTLDDDICKNEKNIDSGICKYCNDTNACNKINYNNKSCMVCSSNGENYYNCMYPTPPPSSTESFLYYKTCNQSSDITYEKRGCYSKRTEHGIERGCVNNLTSDELEKCKNFNGTKDNQRFCQICDTQNCNRIELYVNSTLSASMNKFLSLNSILICFIIIFIFNL